MVLYLNKYNPPPQKKKLYAYVYVRVFLKGHFEKKLNVHPIT